MRFLRCRAHSQERRTSARRGCGEMHVAGTLREVAADYHRCACERWCSRVQRNHGGLTPPAPGAVATTSPEECDFCAQTHTHKSGGRQPAVGVSNAVAIAKRRARQPAVGVETTFAQTRARLSAAPTIVCAGRRCIRVQRHHGGLTLPAPGAVATIVRRKNAIFAMQGRTFTRAAGVSPPWLGNTDGVLQKWIIGRQQPYARTTVPSVSPPWVWSGEHCR
jgi:hypothetical protein